jgi:outer membrane lipoprotein carrier protein
VIGRVGLRLGVIAFVGPVVAASDALGQDAETVLSRAEEVYEEVASIRASFVQVIDVPLVDRRREGRGTWYQKGTSFFKMDFSDPDGDVLVADGTYLWAFYPSRDPRQVVRSTIDETRAGEGPADFHGRILEDIVLSPTDRGGYQRVRIWIDSDTYLIRRFEFTELSETVRTIELSDIELNAEIEDATFEFEPPPGVEVFEG